MYYVTGAADDLSDAPILLRSCWKPNVCDFTSLWPRSIPSWFLYGPYEAYFVYSKYSEFEFDVAARDLFYNSLYYSMI